MSADGSDLASILRRELEQPLPPEASALVQAIIETHGDAVAAILFYGSCLRDRTADGILDFYVVVDSYRDYHGRLIAALFNRLLPPTVSLWTIGDDAAPLRAKVAVISRGQFARRIRPHSLDVTLWARFCQPVALAYVRNEEAAEWVLREIGKAVSTAALWGAWLGPERGRAADYWLAVFRKTYRAELRPETRGDRAGAVVAADAGRYDGLLPLAWKDRGVAVERLADGNLKPTPPRGSLAWWPRRATGKVLTVMRLAKASFTFANGADYIAWKIKRHSGYQVNLSPWQRQHPLLAAPLILWRLWRRGVIQ
jgi:predicted nucleotidyltransferase